MQPPLQIFVKVLFALHATYPFFSGLHLVSCSMPWIAGAHCPAGIGSFDVKSIVAYGFSLTGLEQVS